MNPIIERMRASIVPAGRTLFGAEFPGTSCLANFRGQFATFRVKEGGMGKGGKMAVKWTGFSHVFPHVSTQVVDFPLLSRLGVEGVYELRVRSWELRKKVAEGGWSVRKSADCYGLFGFPSPPRDGCPRGVVRWRETWSRKFTKVRTDQARNSAMLRIVTPQSLFRRELHV